jgi:threonylcarbamoyladenosine tRNA methylthiotransferase MtaB
MKTVKFFTLGCKVNQYDTQEIRERFLERGFKEIYNGKKSDICVINTCTVTHRADADSLGLIRRAKKENPRAKIIVTGCLAELDGGRIAQIPGVTHIIKNSQKSRLIELLNSFDLRPTTYDLRPQHGISRFDGHTRAFLKIQDGCDNFCSYCKVPSVRGKSRSKELSQIRQEAEHLAKNNFKEIVLCGICLGAYGRDLKPRGKLVDAIDAIEGIEGILRIRLSSIEAADVSEDLIRKFRQSKKLCRHLHIPIQSGDDEILKKMNRRYTRSHYLGLIKKIKQRVPGIAITTDVLVGFPGESDDNFRNTLKLVKEIMPLKVHIFPYSKREATAAAKNFGGEVSQTDIKERVLKLKNIADKCAFNYKSGFLQKNKFVLIEGRSKEHPGHWEGYTDNYLKVAVRSRGKLNLNNRVIPLKLKKIRENNLIASF